MRELKVWVFISASIPLIILLFEFLFGALGFDPLDRITRMTGRAALILLLASLLITPLRHWLMWIAIHVKAHYGKRLSDWNWLIKLRRMIGLFSSFYASLHLIIYVWLDQGANLTRILSDIYERKFILVGVAAFILLIPVTVTSTDNMRRKLGKNWRRIHRLVYLIAILAVTHFWMLTKVGVYDPYPYIAAVVLLLGWRVWYIYGISEDETPNDGMEVTPR